MTYGRAATHCHRGDCTHVQPCPDHPDPTPWAGSPRHDQLPPGWAALRLARFAHDNWTCTATGCTYTDPTHTGTGLEADHIGNKHDHRIEMLRTKCARHHRDHTTTQRNEQIARLKGPLA